MATFRKYAYCAIYFGAAKIFLFQYCDIFMSLCRVINAQAARGFRPSYSPLKLFLVPTIALPRAKLASSSG